MIINGNQEQARDPVENRPTGDVNVSRSVLASQTINPWELTPLPHHLNMSFNSFKLHLSN